MPEQSVITRCLAISTLKPDSTSISILGAWQGTDEGSHLQALAEDTEF